jgi:BirA family biotin operon repressor/biotin-[acetyl-CoA-carboxylase] ligase
MSFPYQHYHYKEVASTQQTAFTNAAKQVLDRWYLYTTDFQAEGQGRNQGSAWLAPNGSSILATYCKVHSSSLFNVESIITLKVALAVARTVAFLEMPAKIKWPNDVVLQGKKVAGILADVKYIDGKACLMIGVGINVNLNKEDCASINQNTTSLSLVKGLKLDVEAVLHALNIELENLLEAAPISPAEINSFLEDYNKDYVIFSPCGVLGHADNITAIISGVDKDGALILNSNGHISKHMHGKLFKQPLC